MIALDLVPARVANRPPSAPAIPAPTPTPAPARPDFAATGLTPAFLYHPASDAVTLDGAGRVTAVAGVSGSPDLATPGIGPVQRVDGAGMKCWRFENAALLDLPDSFTVAPRAFTLFIVGRQHKRGNRCYFFSTKYQGDGTTPANVLGALFATYGVSNRAPWMNVTNQYAYNATNLPHMAIGSQLSCFGVASRTTANGGLRYYQNGQTGGAAQAGSALTGCKGGRFGGYFYTGDNSSGFDAYCIVGFAGELTNAQADAVSAVLTGHYGLSAITRNLILDGDSITDGVGEVPSGGSLGMWLTEPGAGLIPAGVRVINTGISGAQVDDCVLRRDNAQGWPLLKIGADTADNLIALQIGRNDTYAGGKTPAQCYDAIKAYWNDATTGVLARGWGAAQMANIACDAGATSAGLHDLITTNFAADVAGGRVIDLQLIRDSNGGHGANFAPFVPGAANATYYQGSSSTLDTTHPSAYGTRIMASGGDTPAHGYGALF